MSDVPSVVVEPLATAESATGKPAAKLRRRRAPKMPTRRVLISRLGAEVVKYLDGLTLAQLLCLAYGHTWPILVPGKGRPRGWRANLAPSRDGVFLITENCTRDETHDGKTCGSLRSTYTGERGIFLERGRHRQYRYDDSTWQKRPEGSRITRIDVLDYIMTVMGEELFANGSEPAEGEGGLA